MREGLGGGSKLEGADANAGDATVEAGLAVLDADGNVIQRRRLRAPEARVLDEEALGDGACLARLELEFGTLRHCRSIRNKGAFHGDGARAGVVVTHLGIDEDLGALIADVGIVDKDTATCHLVFFKGIGDSHLILSNEPHVAVDATVVGEVELCLFFARGVGFVVAVVGADGDDEIVVHSSRQGDGDGQVATLMFFHFLAIDIDGLLTHDGFEVQGDVTASTLLGQTEMLTIPGDTLIVTAATGLCRHQLDGMGCGDDFPCLVVEVLGLGTCHIAQMKAPARIEVPHLTTTILQRKETGYGGLCHCRGNEKM